MCKYLLIIPYALVGAILTWAIIDHIVKPYIKKTKPPTSQKDKDRFSEAPCVVFFSGFFEIILYCGSFLVAKPEFIVVWIGFKTALKWDRKFGKTDQDISEGERRGLYHSNLLGTALNIVFGFIAACFIEGKFLTF